MKLQLVSVIWISVCAASKVLVSIATASSMGTPGKLNFQIWWPMMIYDLVSSNGKANFVVYFVFLEAVNNLCCQTLSSWTVWGLTSTNTAVDLTESFLWQQGPVLRQEADIRFLSAQLVVPDVPVTLKYTNTSQHLGDPWTPESWFSVSRY